VNGTAAELERCGPIADEKRDPGGPDEVEGALIADRSAHLAALTQAGAGLFGIGLCDGQAHREKGNHHLQRQWGDRMTTRLWEIASSGT
jgi:hypothetical protein